MIPLDGNSLTLEDLNAIAHEFAPVAIAPAALERVRYANYGYPDWKSVV